MLARCQNFFFKNRPTSETSIFDNYYATLIKVLVSQLDRIFSLEPFRMGQICLCKINVYVQSFVRNGWRSIKKECAPILLWINIFHFLVNSAWLAGLKIATEATTAASTPRHRCTGWNVRMSTAGKSSRGEFEIFEIKLELRLSLFSRILLDNSSGTTENIRKRYSRFVTIDLRKSCIFWVISFLDSRGGTFGLFFTRKPVIRFNWSRTEVGLYAASWLTLHIDIYAEKRACRSDKSL